MILDEEQLLEWTRYTSRGYLKSWLDKKQINYFLGSGGAICTTTEAVNDALKRHSDLGNNQGGTFERAV